MEGAAALAMQMREKREQEGYDRAHSAIRNNDANYFAQKGWAEYIRMSDVFIYAARHKPLSEEVLAQIIRTMVSEAGFSWTFNELLRLRANVWCLKTLIQYKPTNEKLEDMRFGFIRPSSVLHRCAEANHLSWLKYFVEDLEFKFHLQCWADSRGYGVLYYAAENDSLDVAQYLVHECRQSPTQKAGSAFSKTPFDVAKPAVRAFFQNSNCHYVKTGAIRQHGLDYQLANSLGNANTNTNTNINNNNNESALQKGSHETSPLLRRSSK